jgi:hypothetical protein
MENPPLSGVNMPRGDMHRVLQNLLLPNRIRGGGRGKGKVRGAPSAKVEAPRKVLLDRGSPGCRKPTCLVELLPQHCNHFCVKHVGELSTASTPSLSGPCPSHCPLSQRLGSAL